jgi:hypothetical protein
VAAAHPGQHDAAPVVVRKVDLAVVRQGASRATDNFNAVQLVARYACRAYRAPSCMPLAFGSGRASNTALAAGAPSATSTPSEEDEPGLRKDRCGPSSECETRRRASDNTVNMCGQDADSYFRLHLVAAAVTSGR